MYWSLENLLKVQNLRRHQNNQKQSFADVFKIGFFKNFLQY